MGNMDAWRAVPLGQALDYLALVKEQHWAQGSSPGQSHVNRAAHTEYQRAESAYNSLHRVLGYLALGAPPVGAVRLPTPPTGVPCHRDPCPVCGQLVAVEAAGTVWVCPTSRRREEPGYLVPVAKITQEMRRKSGVWTDCGHDYGLECYPEVPVHAKCCDTDVITYAANPGNERVS